MGISFKVTLFHASRWRVILPGDLARLQPRQSNNQKLRSRRSTTLHWK